MTKKVQFNPRFVNTRNASDFAAMMDGLLMSKTGRDDGDERLGCVFGRAGFGKTRTVKRWAANHGAVYLETVEVCSELDFLKALCAKLGILRPAGRRGKCFFDAVDILVQDPSRVLFVDEIERFGQKMLEVVRDIAKFSGGVIVLIGEEELPHLMKQNRRVWSRTYQTMKFSAATPADIVGYVRDATGLKLTTEAMHIIHKLTGGDMRTLRSASLNLVHVVNSMGRYGDVIGETAQMACDAALKEIRP